MPLSNVFRHSFPNPFHNLSRKNRHALARSGSTAGSPSSIVVVPVVEDKSNSNSGSNTVDFITPLPSTLGRSDSRKSISLKDKGKGEDISKLRRKGNQSTPKSAHSSLSACHLERLDPDAIPRPSSPSSDLISHLHISKAPLSLSLQEQQQHMSALSSPTSTSFSPSPFSPHISMPTSPSAPSTPLVTNSPARILSASPEPLTPTLPTIPTNLATSGTLGSRSRFGSLFTTSKTRHNSEERVLSDPEVHAKMGKDKINSEPLKKKRMSTGSLQIPIGAFLSSTFRNKQQGAQQQPSQPESLQPVQEQTQTQQQQPLQRKKRRGLLPKLPKLDTRPKIIASKSGSKKQKEAAKQVGTGYGDNGSSSQQAPLEISTQDPNAALGPDLGWVVVPGSTETAKQGGGGGRRKSSTRLLSPFYLPRQIRTGAGSHPSQNLDPNVRLPPPMMGSTGGKNDSLTTTTASGSQARQQFVDFYPAFEFEWHADSQVFYDDRWDRASVRTVDTEIMLLADDPNFPDYPDRNDYWQQHCRIRERRWKHQIQKHQQQQMTDARSGLVEGDPGSLLDEDDEDDEGRITDQLNSLPEGTARRGRQSTAPSSSHRQNRVRYTTYSAYIAAMQVKSKNRTDHKRSLDVAAMASPTAGTDTDRLMTDVHALRERSLTQPANVKETVNRFGDATMGGDTMADPRLDPTRQSSLPEVCHGQRRYARHHDGTNLGSSDDESEDQYEAEDRAHPMSSFASLQRQRQPDSGILFVAAAATTAEVYPTLVHDPRDQMLNKSAKSATTTSGNKLKDLNFSPQHNKNASTTPYWIEDGYDEGMIGCLVASYFDKRVLEDRIGGKSDMEGGEGDDQSAGDKMAGNGFMVLQSSFGDQGSLGAHSGPDLDPSDRRPSASDAVDNSNSNSNLNDKNNNDDINNNKNNYDNNNNDNRNSSNNKKDLCLSRPGQYASHNHIMPLEKLLEVEEQGRQRRRQALLEKQELDRQKRLMMEMEEQQQQLLLIYPDGAALDATKPNTIITSTTIGTPSMPSSSSASPAQPSSSSQPLEVSDGSSGSGSSNTFLADLSTAMSVPDTAASSQQPTDSEPISPGQPQIRPQSSGHMLLVLDQGRCQYYENGSRKRGPEWEEGGPEDDFVGHDATEVIEEGEEEVDEKELAWIEQQRLRQESSPSLKRAQKGKGPGDGSGSNRVQPFDGPAAEGGRGGMREREREPSQEVDPLGSLAVIDSLLSPRFANVFSESPTASANSSQIFSSQSSRPSTPSSVNALAPPPRAQSTVVTSPTSSSSTDPPARQASAHGLSTLSRIRAVKSRASLSYSILPTLSTSSYASSASGSTATLLSPAPSTLLNNPPLRHRGSGSMTPGSTLYSGDATTPAAPSSPVTTPATGAVANGEKADLSSSSSALLPGRKLSWSDVPNQPPTVTATTTTTTATTTTTPSAIAFLLDALTKPPPPPGTPQGEGTGAPSKTFKSDSAQKLKQQWDQKMRSQSALSVSTSARSRSMLLSPPPMTISGSKTWMRNPVHLLAPPPSPPSSGQGDTAAVDKKQQDQKQRHQGALSEGDLETHLETEADQEMEDELRQLLDDATHDNAQYQTKKAAVTRRPRRAMSMVELSASTTASQYKAAVSATRQRYKAEASTSTSTVDILQSEGMYQWNEFFDV
ncbi:hypothetical protein EC957_003226 [Mortierella hygrophila]|uniref:Uncharacterized protein n=1 Tax=Mortierella hygrophila TaxID=979708 RepID=A0A9P6F3U4_9FUNG|nr:hypothetical protein EC957_003226 [Mortierella hygrophila]